MPGSAIICRLTHYAMPDQNVRVAHLLLDEVLKKKKVSKRQFAKRLGMDYASVFRYFREGYDPKLSTLERFAKALDCRIRDLYEE